MPLPVSAFDLAGRVFDAAAPLFRGGERALRERVARAIEALSEGYRRGSPRLDYRTVWGRLAYLFHALPAYACDLRGLLAQLDWPGGREACEVLAIGGGPGTEAVAALDAATAAGGAPRRLRVVRADREPAWDQTFAPLARAAEEAYAVRGADLEVDLPAEALEVDLARGPTAALVDAAARADLAVAANVLSEVPPRLTPALPAEALAAFAAVARAMPEGSRLLLVDRRGSPGIEGRMRAVLEAAAAARPGARVEPPRQRDQRCGCALTRRAREVYALVRLETTKVEDRPIRNCRSIWASVLV